MFVQADTPDCSGEDYNSAAPVSKTVRRRSLRADALNLPNLLTFLRIGMVPAVLFLMGKGSRQMSFWAAMVYTLAAITDALDGWLARKRNLISVLGKFLDPLADKLLVLATLVYMVAFGYVAPWVVVLIIARELSITTLRTIAISEGVVIAASDSGKEKTAVQMVAIFMLIMYHTYSVDFFVVEVTASFHIVGVYLLYVSLVLAFLSGGEYVRLFISAVEAKEKRALSKGPGENEDDFTNGS